MGVSKVTGIRLLGVATLTAAGTLLSMFSTFLLLTSLFTEPGPIGPVEPHWPLATAVYAPIVVTSALAGALYDGALPARLWPHFVLGLLVGVFLDSLWLALQLARSQPFDSAAAAGYLVLPLLGASGATLSGLVRRRRWQDYLDA